MTKARPPAWDKYEAALLLEGLLDIKRNNIPRNIVVKRVSVDLRKMARNRGRDIDDMFRNVSGITFQIQSMESAYCGYTVFKPATKLFSEIADMYRSDCKNYEILLKEAKEMIAESKSIETQFFEYLAKKVSPAQLSALYPCYSEIETFCTKNKILQKPLFETTESDAIRKVQRTIEQNKSFRITHRKQYDKILSAGRYYFNYIYEGRFLKKESNLTEDKSAESPAARNEIKPAESVQQFQPIRTEQDKRLAQKYPKAFNYIFKMLRELSNSSIAGVSIGEIETRIGRIARPTVIEEILDNASWSFANREAYTFSAELVDHSISINGINELQIEDSQREAGLYTIDFRSAFNLSYTKPESFTYFGEMKMCGNSWATLYVNLVSTLIEDYPHLFKAGMSFSKSSARIELADKADYSFMFAPKAVPETNYMLETNVSANNIAAKIKYILDICQVDYENIIIQYKRKTHDVDSSVADKKSKNQIPLDLHPALKLQEKVAPLKNKFYEDVLKQFFKKGFRMDSPLEVRKFKRYYDSMHNTELIASDEEINENMRRMCIIYDGKAFLPEMMLSNEMKEKLLKYIDDAFAEGKVAIYYQAIFTEFAEAFLNYHIYNADMLRAYLAHINNGEFFINRSFVSKDSNVDIDPMSEIRECLREYARPMDYEEIFSKLPHLPQNKIKIILSSNGEFVNNNRGLYFHESSVCLSDEDLENIADIIMHSIEDKEFMGGNELYDAIKAKYPYIIENNNFCSVYGFRDALKYKLGERFSFKGNIISRAGQELSMTDVFANYAKKHDSFTLTELQSLANELATVIYFDPIYKNSLRISKEQFVTKSQAQFAVAETDAAIDRICTDNYISIREITNFGVFPYAGFPWNSFLLEHFTTEYSQKYMLLHSSYNGTECAGAIVKKNAGIHTFDEFIVDFLANSNVELDKASALQLLSDKGYLARRRYSNIESLIIQANALRKRKDTD